MTAVLLNGGIESPPNPPILGGTGIFKAPRIGGLGAARFIAFRVIHACIQQRR